MADIIYFSDGTKEVIWNIDTFLRVLEEKLGRDVIEWYNKNLSQETSVLKFELEQADSDICDYQIQIDFYRDLCFDAITDLDEIINLVVNSKRLNKQKLVTLLSRTKRNLEDNL